MRNLNINSHQEYLNYILNYPEEVDLFVDKFTINYTYFFRNYEVFEKLKQLILSNEFKFNQHSPIYIWSCPCASGDEPYSIAILLDQIKKVVKNFPDYKIIASDIDTRALGIARDGVFGEYAVHEIPKAYLQQYFTKSQSDTGPRYTIRKDIKDKVEFLKEDITVGHKINQKYKIIFCRNFLIYLEGSTREKFLRILENRLLPDGILVLGKTETIRASNHGFEITDVPNRIYSKRLYAKERLVREKPDFPIKTQERKRERQLIPHVIPKPSKIKPLNSALVRNKIKLNPDLIKREDKDNRIKTVPKRKKPLEKQEKVISVSQNHIIKETPKSYLKILPKSPQISIENQNQNIIVNIEEKNKKEELIKRMEKLIQREKQVEKNQEFLEQSKKQLDDQIEKIEQREKRLDQQIDFVEQRESEMEQREKQVEHLIEQIAQKAKLFVRREKKLQLREKRLNLLDDQLELLDKNENGLARQMDLQIEKLSDPVDIYADERADRITKPNTRGELVIPVGYFALINLNNTEEFSNKFSIIGLGSGIACLFVDKLNKVYAMSNILLPSSSSSKDGAHLRVPHQFADTSVKDLYNNMLYHGADKKNIKAILIGGSKLSYDHGAPISENINVVKNELSSLHITVEHEELGGLSERQIVYETTLDSLFIKKSWEKNYRKIKKIEPVSA